MGAAWLIGLMAALAPFGANAQTAAQPVKRDRVMTAPSTSAATTSGDRVPSRVQAAAVPVSMPSGDAVSPSTAPAGFFAYLQGLGARAVAAGVRAQTVANVLPTIVFSPTAVTLDRRQGSNAAQTSKAPMNRLSNFAAYRRTHVDPIRIQRGRARYAALRPFLFDVERQTGVPESIMVSIWGNETSYGAVVGSHDLPSVLATLAFEGRRRAMFEAEFIDSLKILDRGIPRGKLKGSWAGATGHPQFMPSAYLRLARDGDRDSRIDIWSSEADALASIANYFVEAGWKRGEPWGVAVTVPTTFNRAAYATRLTSPRCTRVFQPRSRWLTMAEWQALGVVPIARGLTPDTLAVLIEPDGYGRTGYLVTNNYQVILDYNCLNFYALSVGLLADAIAQ